MPTSNLAEYSPWENGFVTKGNAMKYQSFEEFCTYIAVRNPGQPEYMQGVAEVMESLWPFIAQHPKYAEHGLLDRLAEPERVIIFRVAWVDDHGEVNVNLNCRIQHSSSIGPYKGGTTFSSLGESLCPEISCIRADFQECAYHATHGRRQGRLGFRSQGAKSGRSDAFLSGLYERMFRHIGSDVDVPAGDIGVGGTGSGIHGGHDEKAVQPRGLCFYRKRVSASGAR